MQNTQDKLEQLIESSFMKKPPEVIYDYASE